MNNYIKVREAVSNETGWAYIQGNKIILDSLMLYLDSGTELILKDDNYTIDLTETVELKRMQEKQYHQVIIAKKNVSRFEADKYLSKLITFNKGTYKLVEYDADRNRFTGINIKDDDDIKYYQMSVVKNELD